MDGLPVTKDMYEVLRSGGLLHRTKCLFNNDWSSDGAIKAGLDGQERLIPIHKSILFPASEPPAAMLSDHWKKDEVTRIKEFKSTVVLSAIRWAYCDEVVYLEEDLADLFRFSSQYMMKPLFKKLSEKMPLNESSIWQLLAICVDVDGEHLRSRCRTYIEVRANKLIVNEAFLDIPSSALVELTSMDALDVTELQLFKRCLDWAERQCEVNKQEVTNENVRSWMLPFVYNFAFRTMSYKEFSGFRRNNCPLTERERLLVYDSMSDDAIESPFRRQRKYLKTLWCDS